MIQLYGLLYMINILMFVKKKTLRVTFKTVPIDL